MLSRLRIGHSSLNSTLFIIGKHPTGCDHFQEPKTVEHIFTVCRKLAQDRQNDTITESREDREQYKIYI